MTLTLPDLHALALRWCPRPARWSHLLRARHIAWGPAHEIAHALLSLPAERRLADYGMCSAGFCCCPGDRCDIVETAAIKVSARLLVAAGRPDAVQLEADATEGYADLMTPWHVRRAHWLLGRRGLRLGTLPRTRAELERLLERRVGR